MFYLQYHKIPKISPGAYIFQRSFFEGFGGAYLLREICISKFTIFALFYFVFVGNFQVQAP